MNILLCGATGFIGRHLEQALIASGHHVVRAIRQPKRADDIAVDFVHDTDAATWSPRLVGIDMVVNAVGVLRDSTILPMRAIHADTPKALFDACAQVGCKVVHISALGAGGELKTAYMHTKGEAQAHLINLSIPSLIVRPSLVYGQDGDSAKMFRLLARMPVVAVPGQSESWVQPVHIDDIAQLVTRQINQDFAWSSPARVVDAVGAVRMTYREMIACYRAQMSDRPAWVVPIPWGVMRIMAKLAQIAPSSALDPDTLQMLQAGSFGDVANFAALLGRMPRHPNTFIE
ncbi:MAG: hypothetical protein H6R05_636 [Burkholderiaceae bacterium]|nr:hypothetical protein [Burkholderiaceae bacterium]